MSVKSELSESVLDSELQEFCKWFKWHYDRTECYESTMITCLCGHFHTFPKQANLILARLAALDLVAVKKTCCLSKIE